MARRHTAAQRRRGDIWTRVVLLACLAYAGLNLARMGAQELRLTRQHLILAQEQKAVDEKRVLLHKQVAEARSYKGTEHLARKVLVMAKPDEIPVVFLKGAVPRIVHFRDPQASPAPAPATGRPDQPRAAHPATSR